MTASNVEAMVRADVIGAAGELAVALVFGRAWVPAVEPDTGIGDVYGVQVRSTAWATGHLIVRRGDFDDDQFVLVTGTPPWLTVQGWLTAREAKCRAYLRRVAGRPPCYMVPQRDLRPLKLRPRRR